ncbi:MAG: hypothetical protein FWF87_00955 [Synergistaceae bacterium]|nr:hypothetical protein [Synergistaceae bacterium]
MKKYIRWLFLIAFLAFAAMMRNTRMMYANPNMFIILWLLASFIVVLGVVFFRDKTKDNSEFKKN